MSKLGVAAHEVAQLYRIDDVTLYDVCEWLGVTADRPLTPEELELVDMGVEP